MTIGIIGHGAIGTALGNVFTQAEAAILFWDQLKERSTVNTLPDLITPSDVIILAVPSWVNRSLAQQIADNLQPGGQKLVISVSKGVEKGFVTVDQILSQESQGRFDYGLLYGPMLAEDLAIFKPTAAVLAVSNERWHNALSLHPNQALRLQYSTDLPSVAWCGALKNIYALGFGMLEGLEAGTNANGVFSVRVLAELRQVLTDRHLDPQLADGLAGLGDVLATGWSGLSFNHRIGKAIAERLGVEKPRGEGPNSLAEIKQVIELERYPIIQTLYNIVYADKPPQSLEQLIA